MPFPNEITHEGNLDINGLQIPCFVLKGGTRILSGRGLQEALRIRDKPEEGEKRGGYILPGFFESKAFKPYVDSKLEVAKFTPIICKRGNQTVHGFDAVILADICDAILQARKDGVKMTERQQIVADQCEMIIRSLAKVGIIALIDEATGYQEVREKDALKKFLEKFLQEEQAKWIKTFDDEFFEMIFKMKKWTWSYASTKKPQVVGHYINNLVYARLGPKVLDTITERNTDPVTGKRIGKKFQFLSTDYGHPKLKEHLAALIALGKASGYNWTNFNRMVERAFPKFGDTLAIGFVDEEIEEDQRER